MEESCARESSMSALCFCFFRAFLRATDVDLTLSMGGKQVTSMWIHSRLLYQLKCRLSLNARHCPVTRVALRVNVT